MDDLEGQLLLQSPVGGSEQRSSMTGRQQIVADVALHRRRKLEEAE
jgi:hypothetical protein